MPDVCDTTSREIVAPVRKIDLGNFQGATTKTARDINRQIILNLIRKHQPISRAELSRHSRLQRSTVSAITRQLIAERWVTTGAVGDLPRGRKPTFLHLNRDRAGIIGVDVRPGGTILALADLDMRILRQESMPTSDDPARFTADLSERIRRSISLYPHITFEGIGVALPGRIDLASRRLVFAPNLGWDAADLKGPLESGTGLPVELENAANACALAEIWGGGYPESVRNLVAITVSEGVGAGLLLNGQLVRGSTGLAGEFGHISILDDGPLCNCGNRGCLDVCASNTAAVRYYSEFVNQTNGKTFHSAPTFEGLLKLADADDPSAARALDRMASYLGTGMAMLITSLAPDVIVIVGDVTRAWHRIWPTIEGVIARRSCTGTVTRVVTTDPAMQPRMRGAVALVVQKHFAPPHTI